MRKIKKGDKVQIISGKYKLDSNGKPNLSEIINVVNEGKKVVVRDVNVMKKSVKKQGFVQKTLPIDSSNVQLYCPKCKRGVRVGIIINGKGKKIRQCKKCGEELN